MKKALWLLLLVALVACSPSTANPQLIDPDAEEEAAVSSADETVETAETEPAGGEAGLPMAANLADFEPATTVEEAAVVREQDWRKGAADPLVVIIEYGDFQ